LVSNSTIFYNYAGGIINTASTFTNNGTVNNANGLSTCGVGTINGVIGGNILPTCPPP
jgi:hypothetical protein